MRPCLADEELFALVDGGVAASDAAVLERHLSGCERCARRKASLSGILTHLAADEELDVRAHADSVMAALDRAPLQQGARARSPAAWRRAVPAALATLAVAAALVVGLNLRRQEEGFTARGGGSGETSLHGGVGVTVRAVTGSNSSADAGSRALVSGEQVTAHTRYLAGTRNILGAPAYLLMFAVDASGAVHWLYPAYESERTDPASMTVPPSAGAEVLTSTSVAFEDVAKGRLKIVTLLSREPLHVSDIESRKDLGVETLRGRFPAAEVSTLDLDVVP